MKSILFLFFLLDRDGVNQKRGRLLWLSFKSGVLLMEVTLIPIQGEFISNFFFFFGQKKESVWKK